MANHLPSILIKDRMQIADVEYISQSLQVKFYPFSIRSFSILQDRFLSLIISLQSSIAKHQASAPQATGFGKRIVHAINNQDDDC